MNKAVLFVVIFLSFNYSLAFANDEKASIIEILDQDYTTLIKSADNCQNSLNQMNLRQRVCGQAAIISMSYSTYISALGLISPNEVERMIDNYIKKHGKESLINYQIKVNHGAGVAKNTLTTYTKILGMNNADK